MPAPTPAARWLSELRAHPTHHDLLSAFDLLEKTAHSKPPPTGPTLSHLSQQTSSPHLSQQTSAPHLPDSPVDPAPVRFAHSPDLALAPGELVSILPDPHDPIRHLVTTAGPGPCGPSSPLPLALADDLAGAPLALAVLDLFHHRRTLLLCRGLLAADLPGALDGADPWARRIIALVGLADAPFTPLEALRLAPILAAPDRSPRALALAVRRLLPELGALPTLRCELVPDPWTPLTDDHRSRLGRPAATLGDTATLGAAVRLPSSAARLVVGPVPAATLPALRPGGPAHARLRALLAAFISEPMALELVLEIDDMSLQTCPLGQQTLGRDLWLRPDPQTPRPRPLRIPLTAA